MATIVESTCVGSTPGRECEDILVIDIRDGELVFAAVVDGATDKSGMLYDGHTGGRLMAETVANTVMTLEPDADPYRSVEQLTRAAAQLRRELGISEITTMAPSAGVAMLSVARRELWRVGDCHLGVRVGPQFAPYPGEKAVDIAASLARSAYIACLLAGGHDPEDIARDDPGRRFIMPLLEAQGVLSNMPEPSPFAYGVIDGRNVPARLIEVLPLPPMACEVVIASDGFIKPEPTLADAERTRAESVASDPLRIGMHRGTKSLKPGAVSFDDRTWVRVKVPAAVEGTQTAAPEAIRRRFWRD